MRTAHRRSFRISMAMTLLWRARLRRARRASPAWARARAPLTPRRSPERHNPTDEPIPVGDIDGESRAICRQIIVGEEREVREERRMTRACYGPEVTDGVNCSSVRACRQATADAQ